MHVFVWKYEPQNKNYPGYHFTCDASGAEYIRTELERETHPLKRFLTADIKLSKPTWGSELCVPNCKTPVKAFKTLSLSIGLQNQHQNLQIKEDANALELLIPPAQVNELLEHIEGTLQGEGDYSIDAGNSDLWFWWRVT